MPSLTKSLHIVDTIFIYFYKKKLFKKKKKKKNK